MFIGNFYNFAMLVWYVGLYPCISVRNGLQEDS